MFDSRKLAFILGAMLVAGSGLYGCEEEQDWGPIIDGSTGSNGNTDGSNGNGGSNGSVDVGEANPSDAPKICQNPDKCMTSTECGTKDGIAACLCVTIPNRCRYDEKCEGIGSCKYECSTEYVDANGTVINTCAWSVCAGKEECGGACNPATLDADGDFDDDGILNKTERDFGKSNPCLADTDGDTIPDGEEDLNHDGRIQIEYGETDPSNPNSKPSSDKETAVKSSACNSDAMLKGDNITLADFRVAKLDQAEFLDSSSSQFTLFNHTTHGVVGFFGTGEPMTGSRLLNQVTEIGKGNFIEESSFKSTVPLATWSKGGVYQENLQIVPNHTVDRYKLTINMSDDDTLESLRDAIAKQLFKTSDIPSLKGSTKCNVGGDGDQNKAILYLARSSYSGDGKSMYIYSAALGCRNVVAAKANNEPAEDYAKRIAASNVMEDTLSGTLVAPRGIGNTNGYEAFKQFVCQAQVFGQSQGAVDFIWVIDNSGSMEDEIANLTKTVDEFTKRLDGSGIDYRLAVTTTDAYLVDEQGTFDDSIYSYDKVTGGNMPVTYMPYVTHKDPSDVTDHMVDWRAYFNGLGIHTLDPMKNPCMLAGTTKNLELFKNNVSKFSTIEGGCDGNLNICGKGYEDGFKSAGLVLERLFLNVYNEKPEGYDQAWWDEFVEIKRHVAYRHTSMNSTNAANWTCLGDDANTDPSCSSLMDTCMLRNDALKYIIFVSDEDSRQFKERGTEKDGVTTLVSDNDSLNGCLTGYELLKTGGLYSTLYSMATGSYTGQACNQPLADYKEKLNEHLVNINSTSSLEGMTLEEIEPVLGGRYYDMLTYYMDMYRKYAGSQSVVAFALVGDAGLNAGGMCQELGVCEVGCTEELNGKCIKCGENNDKWNHNNPSAKTGANHGLSYIHLARFLSTVYTDATGTLRTDGQEGGYGSICNDNYTVTVNSIFEDVVGRVAAHPLKGYPIASTIKVSAIINGKAEELTRGDTNKGWRYDASQNAIIFSFSDQKNKPGQDDYIAISYVIWKAIEG